MGTKRWFLAFIMVLMVLSSFPLMNDEADGEPTRRYLDIAVADITWTSSWGGRVWPGADIEVNVTLGHDVDPLPSTHAIIPVDNLVLVVVSDDGYSNVSTTYHSIPNLGLEYTLEAGPAFNPYSFTFMMQANISNGKYEGSISINAMLMVTGDNDTTDNSLAKSMIVQNIDSQPFIWEEGQQDRTYESPVPHWGEVGQTVSIPFQLQNRGLELDTFEFVVLEVPEGWSISLGGPYRVLSEDHEDVDLFVTVSKNPLNAPHDEELRIIVKVRSIYQTDMVYDEPTYHSFLFKVRFMPGAEIVPEKDTVTFVPGGSHQVLFMLNNTGNGQDDYVLDLQIDDVHLQKGWNFQFESGTRMPTVNPGELFNVIIRVTIPAQTPQYYNAIIELELRSMNSDFTTVSDPCLIMVGAMHAADIEEIKDPFDVEPGEVNIVQFNFTNLGNTADQTLDLLVSYAPRDWFVFINKTALQDPLRPLTTIRIPMQVYVLETTVSSDKASLPFIVIQATGGESEHVLDEERFYFKIPPRQKALVTADKDIIHASPGDQISFNFTIENRGNWLDTFNVTMDGVELTFDRDPSTFEIAPNETIQFQGSFQVPFDLPADGYPETVWPVNGTNFDPYQLFLQVRSQNETEHDISLSEHEFRVFIEPVYGIETEMIDGPVWNIPFNYDQERTFMVEVLNVGNCIMKMNISLQQDLDWVEVIQEQVEVAYNGTWFVPIFLKYDAFDMEAYADMDLTLNLDVIKLDRNKLKTSVNLKFSFPPYLYSLHDVVVHDVSKHTDGYYGIDPGTNHSFSVTVVREGREMYLPDDIEGPYLVCTVNGMERFREMIQPIAVGNNTVFEIGPLPILFEGMVYVNFTIEGMDHESEDGVSEMTVHLLVEKEDDGKGDTGELKASTMILLIIGVILIVLIVIGVGISLQSKGDSDISEKDENKKELDSDSGPLVGAQDHQGDATEE